MKYRSNSLWYGVPRLGANKFPGYSTAELLRDLESPTMDAETRANIEAEIARRATRRNRRSK